MPVPGRVSVIIPSRCERFLPETVRDVLTNARGDLECVVSLDSYWPDPPLPNDPRLILVHHGTLVGMRDGINSAVQASSGSYILKLDGHCMLPEGYDEVLKSECDDDWVVVPRRRSLEPLTWTIIPKSPVDAHYLSYPFAAPDDWRCGLHGTVWPQRARERQHILIDEEMSSQGSCYFLHRTFWDTTIGPLDSANYGNFIQEFQEIGCRAWLSGGKVMVNKKTWYAHLHKGKQFGRGYQFTHEQDRQFHAGHGKGRDFAIAYWMGERGAELRKLIERFSPCPTWPADLDEAFRKGREFADGHPEALALVKRW